jgi:nucleoside 2-deoxyribosyltransferase
MDDRGQLVEGVYGGKRHFIYLAGNISNDPETYGWRERYTQMVFGEYFVTMDPCDNQFNQDHRGNIVHLRTDPSEHLGILMPKDFHMVKKASIMVVNLELWTPEKPMIGTIFELDWARQFFLPVIGIVGDGTSPYCNHIWIKSILAFGTRVKDVDEAAEVTRYFFAPAGTKTE